jgi:hypothetical protein
LNAFSSALGIACRSQDPAELHRIHYAYIDPWRVQIPGSDSNPRFVFKKVTTFFCSFYYVNKKHERRGAARTAAFAENTVAGCSDHMVRGWDGEFLAARPGLPHAALYESTVASLLDHWREWGGMRGTAAVEGALKL